MSIEFRERLSALLPPPRDDEPASLRQDILDELADHLICAYNRELLRSGPIQCCGTSASWTGSATRRPWPAGFGSMR